MIGRNVILKIAENFSSLYTKRFTWKYLTVIEKL